MPHFVSTALEAELDRLLSEPIKTAEQRARTAFDEEVAPNRGKFILFGAGNIGRRVLARLREDGIEPLGFSDNRPAVWGTIIDGLPVLSPEDAGRRHGRDAAFIVTIYNHQHSFVETRKQLEALGCANVVSVVPLRWKYHESFLPYYRDDLPHKVLPQAELIREAYALWSDEPSCREFVAQVSWRLRGDFGVLSEPLLDQQYFPEDLFKLVSDEFFVDVGAYDGDTLQKFIAFQGSEFSKIVAMEPDPENFIKLRHYVENLPMDLKGKIEALPLAAGEHTSRLSFAAGDGTSSAISEHGTIEVECVRLDDLLKGSRPTYIKMDIEGAEPAAIEGCRHIIGDQSPIMAACVYHMPDHLWRIPLAISQMSARYRFFLRPYMPECWETVCYAIPEDRLAH